MATTLMIAESIRDRHVRTAERLERAGQSLMADAAFAEALEWDERITAARHDAGSQYALSCAVRVARVRHPVDR